MPKLSALTPTLLVLLLTGCATQTKPSSNSWPELPPKPPASTPQPTKPYLQTVSDDIARWERQLKDTLMTPKP